MKPIEPPVPSVRDAVSLDVRVVLDATEVVWFDTQLADHHYLGAGRAIGDYLRQVVAVDGRAAALLVWGPACYALRDRDRWIYWSASQRVERLKLSVQKRRFLVLAPKGQLPNLGSQTMGAALRALPQQWREQFGYRPLLGLPLKKGTRAFRKVPGYEVFYQVLTRMDPEAFAAHLHCWLLARARSLPQALALDGKMIRDAIGGLTLAPHEDGAPQALAVYDQKEGTPRGEQTAAAAQLVESLPALEDKLITADPLHCQRSLARSSVDKGGDYLFQVKGNQPNLLRQAQGLDALPAPPFSSKPKPAMDASKSAGSIPSPSNP